MSKSLGRTLVHETTPAAVAARSEMLDGFTKLLQSGHGSDMTITCKGQTFKVHSAIIASRSDFFAAAFWGPFKEAQTHCIDLPDDDPTDVEAMVEYLYTLDYRPTIRNHFFAALRKRPISSADSIDITILSSINLSCNASMYGMGEKYGIHGLKGIASENFAAVLNSVERYVDGNWISNIHTRALRTVTKRIYDNTPESDKGLRDHVLGYAKLHLERLLPQEDFKAILAEIPEFSYQLLVQEVGSRVSEEFVPSKKRRVPEESMTTGKRKRMVRSG